MKDYFDSHGDLKYGGGKGSGSFVVDIPKVQRKIKGSGDLVISGSNHKVSADLLWNADKDPKQKLHFETDSDLSSKSLNSKYVPLCFLSSEKQFPIGTCDLLTVLCLL